MEILSVIIGVIITFLIPHLGFQEFGLLIGPVCSMVAYFILWILDFQIRKINGKIARESKYKFGTFSFLAILISTLPWYFYQNLLVGIQPVILGFINAGILIVTYVIIYTIWSITDGLIDHYRFLPDKE